jgi:AcrR family transcriptional regulator
MARNKVPAKQRLSRTDWAVAALAAIGERGIAGVAVEPLATRLGATKGSFYWHFKNREELVEVALSVWERQHTTDVLSAVARSSDDPATQLRSLVTNVIETAERDPIGLALLANARHPAVAPVLARVTETRIAAIERLFAAMGLPEPEARRRTLLAYSAYLGHAELAHSTPHVLPTDPAERRAYLDHAMGVLTTFDVRKDEP